MSPNNSALPAESDKKVLVIDETNLPATARALRDLLATSPRLFVRGGPVKLVFNCDNGLPSVVPLTRTRIIIEAHELCLPVMPKKAGYVSVSLPPAVADVYLAMAGDWGLRPLAGITSSPLLSADGSIRAGNGYDPERKLWCATMPELTVSKHPSFDEASACLLTLRHAFKTFPFADSVRKIDGSGIDVVDCEQPPGRDESAFLVALLTAICRASLDLAPGLLVHAPALSGAGTGKGKLVRAICAIAFGTTPTPFTVGESRAELDKRITAALDRGEPWIFLDNVNCRHLKSELLAQLLTEGPVITSRKLGASSMLSLSCEAFVAVTGNAVTISEDLTRRFLACELDAHCEDPEQRKLPGNFLADIQRRRAELLSAALNIWRWGRQNEANQTPGRPLGSFEQWARWCRDAFLTLGSRDPVERIHDIKARDPERQHLVELFETWYFSHADKPVAAADLAEPVRKIVDPQNRSRQFRTALLEGLVGTRIGGFMLTQQKSPGKWGRTTYVVQRTLKPEVDKTTNDGTAS